MSLNYNTQSSKSSSQLSEPRRKQARQKVSASPPAKSRPSPKAVTKVVPALDPIKELFSALEAKVDSLREEMFSR